MRRIDHAFPGVFRAGQAPEDIVGNHLLGLDRIVRVERRVERNRLEILLLRGLLHCVDIQPGGLEQIGGEIALDPAFERRMFAFRIGADDVEHRVGVGVPDRRPAIGGRLIFVDDEHAGGTLARAFLELVGPAAIIGHRPAAEIAFAALEIGIVDQHDHDLALEVDALEIVPAALGRLDAIALSCPVIAERTAISLPCVRLRLAPPKVSDKVGLPTMSDLSSGTSCVHLPPGPPGCSPAAFIWLLI